MGLEWSDVERVRELPPAAAGAAVISQVAPVLDGLAPAETLVVAKSLGTRAAPLVAEHGCAAVWLTPLLRDPQVVDGLRRATAPFLLVGGGLDPLWHAELARELTPHVLEIPGADHGLFEPGPLAVSVKHLAVLTEAVESFLDEVVWPLGATAPPRRP